MKSALSLIDVHVPSKANPLHGHGLGDAIQMLGVIKAVERANPQALVRAVCCERAVQWIQLGHKHFVTEESKQPLADVQLWPQLHESLGGDKVAISKRINRQEMWALEIGLRPVKVAPIIPPEAREWAKEMHARFTENGKRKLVYLSPFAASATRCWPLKRWCELAFLLKDKFALAAMFCHFDKSPPSFFPMVQLQDIPADRTAALFELAACVVSNDSGMAHVAGFMDTPCVAICGPTNGKVVFGCYPSVNTITATNGWNVENGKTQNCAGCLGEGAFFRMSCHLECEILHNVQAFEVAAMVEMLAR